jgi:cytochrome P450
VPKEGCIVNGHFLPSGTVVAASSIYIHRDETLFPDAASFRPERWLDESGNFSNSLDTYLCQFGKGARMCIGRHLAAAEIYYTLAMVFRDCVVSATTHTPTKLVM